MGDKSAAAVIPPINYTLLFPVLRIARTIRPCINKA